MTRLVLPVLFFASPLAASEGAHVHPHSGDPFWSIALLAMVALTAWIVLGRRLR